MLDQLVHFYQIYPPKSSIFETEKLQLENVTSLSFLFFSSLICWCNLSANSFPLNPFFKFISINYICFNGGRRGKKITWFHPENFPENSFLGENFGFFGILAQLEKYLVGYVLWVKRLKGFLFFFFLVLKEWHEDRRRWSWACVNMWRLEPYYKWLSGVLNFDDL